MSFGNKGMYLEKLIDITNDKYNEENICLVSKINAGVNVFRTDNKKILNATFKENFNCDYIGLYKGIYFEFEAKETSKDFFDANLIKKHQYKKMSLVNKHFGISFILIFFEFFDCFIIIDFNKIENYLKTNTKSIPFKWFEKNGFKISINNELKLDYLKYFPYLKNWN